MRAKKNVARLRAPDSHTPFKGEATRRFEPGQVPHAVGSTRS